VRDPHDRRRVIVELGGGPGIREIGPTFGPLVKAWRATAAGYSDDELRLLLEFQGKLEEIMRGQPARLRGDDAGPGGGRGGGGAGAGADSTARSAERGHGTWPGGIGQAAGG